MYISFQRAVRIIVVRYSITPLPLLRAHTRTSERTKNVQAKNYVAIPSDRALGNDCENDCTINFSTRLQVISVHCRPLRVPVNSVEWVLRVKWCDRNAKGSRSDRSACLFSLAGPNDVEPERKKTRFSFSSLFFSSPRRRPVPHKTTIRPNAFTATYRFPIAAGAYRVPCHRCFRYRTS